MSPEFLTAADLMTALPVVMEPTEPLRTAAGVLIERGIHCLLVRSAAGHPPGILTSEGIVLALRDGEIAIDQLLVSDAMTTPSVAVQQDSSIGDCLRLMRTSGARSVAVLKDLEPVGIVSFTDILRAATGSRE
jgi:CBS domain-containing protein